MQSFQEHVLGNEALLSGIAVCAVVLDAVRDLQLVVHAAEVLDQQINLLVVAGAAQVHVVSDNAVASLSSRILGIELDYLGQVHCVCCAVDNMSAVILEDRAGLVSHGVNDTQQSVGERHTSQALCVVHLSARSHVTVVGLDQVSLDHLDRMDSKRVGVVAVCGGYISLNSVSHSVHTCVCNQLLRHSFSQVGINDCNIRSDLEVSDRVFDTVVVISDDGERGDLGSGTGGGRNSAEVCFLSQLGNAEYLAHILKGTFRILVLDPHSLRSVDRRTAAHSHDPVRIELKHLLSAVHNGSNRRIRLNAVNDHYFKSGFLQVSLGSVEESETLHRATADYDNCLFALERLQILKRTLSMIDISR